MAAAVIQEPEAPEVQALTDDTRQELIALREGGMTLAELKVRFPQLTGEQIREVLPAGNARERKQRSTRSKPKTAGEAAKSAKPIGGQAKTENTTEPKPTAEPRYVADPGDLPERVVAARKILGRKVLAEALGISESACWRAEQGRVHPGEVKPLTPALVAVEKRIADGEFKEARQPKAKALTKAELEHRIEAVIFYLREGTKGLSGKAVAAAALALLDPPAEEPRQVCAVCGTGWPTSAQPPAHSAPGAEGPAGETHEFVLKSSETA
jgi:ribosome-binding protein aMBF1 (putative translation factor)